jgi:hypothetical protein
LNVRTSKSRSCPRFGTECWCSMKAGIFSRNRLSPRSYALWSRVLSSQTKIPNFQIDGRTLQLWVPTVFSKNRERLMEGDVAEKFFARVLAQASAAGLVSDEHFSVDGTLIEAWASQKSFQRKDRPEQPPPDDPGNPVIPGLKRPHSPRRRSQIARPLAGMR